MKESSEKKEKLLVRSSLRVRKELSLWLNYSASSVEMKLENGGNIAAATAVGKEIAERAIAKEIKNVVFDRGGYIYHGRVKALAEAAREAGLEF